MRAVVSRGSADPNYQMQDPGQPLRYGSEKGQRATHPFHLTAGPTPENFLIHTALPLADWTFVLLLLWR